MSAHSAAPEASTAGLGELTEIFHHAQQRIFSHELVPIDLLIAAHRLSAGGSTALALDLYRLWIEHNRDSDMLYAMTFNYGMLLSNSGDFAEANRVLSEAIRLNPDFLPAQINLGLVLERIDALGDAVLQWQQIAERLQQVNGETLAQKRTTLKQLGRVFESVHSDPAAEDILRQSLEISPQQRDVLQHWLTLRQRQCEWPVIVPFGDLSRLQMLATMPPLTLATYTDDPMLQLSIAAQYHKLDVGRAAGPMLTSSRWPPPKETAARLRIGYLSSDLRDHAIGYLIAEMFELHDRRKVEVFVYYSGHPVSDGLHLRIRCAVEHWRDIAGMSDEAAAQTIRDDEIDILIDVNGYTHGARTRLLTLRPAPVIVNWLGFPGTMGSPDHHYIIADDFIIPPENELFYSEAVVRLPCYQPNDRQRRSSERTPSRSELGLPEESVVYCCFNGAHKLTPFTWRRWLDILREVPDSVLWLLQGVASTNDRLRRLAAEHGISPERLIFAGRLSNPDHLARYRQADLFLDTTPYGAHTTASDALWMGVPVLTLAGRSFASRVCGSLVRSAGIGELVCSTGEDYVAQAVDLGRNREKLAEFRRRLIANRDGCVLFDTPLLVSAVEKLYREMWQTAQAGRSPRPDLANLEMYGEIGVSLDRDDRELSAADYRALYLDELIKRHEIALIRPDARLWPGDAAGAEELEIRADLRWQGHQGGMFDRVAADGSIGARVPANFGSSRTRMGESLLHG